MASKKNETPEKNISEQQTLDVIDVVVEDAIAQIGRASCRERV